MFARSSVPLSTQSINELYILTIKYRNINYNFFSLTQGTGKGGGGKGR